MPGDATNSQADSSMGPTHTDMHTSVQAVERDGHAQRHNRMSLAHSRTASKQSVPCTLHTDGPNSERNAFSFLLVEK